MKKLAILALGLLICFGLAQEDTSTDTAQETTQETTDMAAGTIVDVLSTNPDLSTLYVALQTAGLAETLTGEGPYTLLAPSNEAFAAAGIDPAAMDPVALQTVLLYHVASGDYMSSDVAAEAAVMTMEGSELAVGTNAEGGVTFNEASVTQPDMLASNGTIHVIDTVLTPANQE